MNIPFKAKLALLITITLWASSFAGIREGLQGYSPGGMALLRFLVATVCIMIIHYFSPTRNKISLRDKFLLIIIGAFGIGCYNLALNYGEISIPSGIASFVISQSPIITAIFAIIFLSEVVNIYLFLGMIISIFGVSLITLNSIHQFDFRLGLLYVFAATVIGSIYTVAQKPFLKKYHAIEITTYVMWGATLSLLIYLPDMLLDLHRATEGETLAVIYLGMFPAAIAYATWGYTLSQMPTAKAASFLYFMPILATFLGWICLGEKLTLMSLAGGVIALSGVWIVNKFSHQKKIINSK